MNSLKPLALKAATCLLIATTMTGCLAERAVVPPTEASWNSREGEASESNDEVWLALIPDNAPNGQTVQSVEAAGR